MTVHLDSLDEAVDFILRQAPQTLRMGAPLGIGKPHRLINALYARLEQDPSRPWFLYTALSLDPPQAKPGLEARFLGPFATRHFGEDFPRLAYVQAMKRDALPAHIEIEEFYMQSGALLGSSQAQRHYASLNYTHVARALGERGLNVIVQKVAREPGGRRLSLSCNNDLTQDAVEAVQAHGLPRPLLVAEVDPQLPWLGGTAAVDEDYFDAVVTPPGPYPMLFGLPRQPVSDAEYAIGLYASALVRDGGTLQIGIGALADALCHALVLRHTDNAAYREVLAALDPELERHPAVIESGGLGSFEIGLYGCSEMINEGFKRLVETGVMRRKVVDDELLMRRVADGTANLGDHARLQRRDARFFNSAMMITALGAAVSDGLEDGRVVSGVGGQYNFVAMAHALEDARSVLMFRALRDADGKPQSNVRWNYGHTTIPRHLRDLCISEYGIADLRGRNDEDCVIAMAGITDARFQAGLLEQAQRNRKLRRGFIAPPAWADNTPAHLTASLRRFRHDGTLPDYPLGSDFTEVEQRLVKALSWLKNQTTTPLAKVGTALRALVAGAGEPAAMTRMGLAKPAGAGEWLEARLLALGLRETRG